MSRDDLHYELLKELTNEPAASQRHLASRMGVSVGKVNYCIRALIDKGWLKANNFRRSDNKLAYTYLLTAKGAAAKIRLTRDFLVRKELEYEALQHELAALRREVQAMPPPPPGDA
jgi:EPS-associated MarR family transcriptional regulator